MPKLRMTRRVTFSSGHRYWISALSEEENRSLFGQWASPYNHGHNYVLDVVVEGTIDPGNGMVVNIKTVDDVLQSEIVRPFHGRSINDEIPAFYDRSSSLENLVAYLFGELDEGILPKECKLVGLRLEEMPGLWAEMYGDDPMITLTRTYEFAASHRLHIPGVDEGENLALFGKCNNPAGHGHNYVLEVTVTGSPDPRTGMLIELEELDRIANVTVVDRYDHKNLNEDIPEFQGKMTTSELVVSEIFNRLKDALPAKLHRVRLHETARSSFEVIADE